MGEDNILHFSSMRGRIRGTGILRARIFGLDETLSTDFPEINMEPTTGRFILKLINFKSQRGCIELKTTDIDEVMRVNKLVIFAKGLYTGFPA